MAGIATTSASLRIFGDDLVPDEVTAALGAQPTRSGRKGEIEVVGRPPAKTGFWQINVQDREPGDLDAQIVELFSMVSSDLSIWRDLRRKYVADIFCGLFMNETNEGETLRVETVDAMGSRGVTLHLDIYGPSAD